MVCKREARRSVEIAYLPMQYSASFCSQLNRFDLPFIQKVKLSVNLIHSLPPLSKIQPRQHMRKKILNTIMTGRRMRGRCLVAAVSPVDLVLSLKSNTKSTNRGLVEKKSSPL